MLTPEEKGWRLLRLLVSVKPRRPCEIGTHAHTMVSGKVQSRVLLRIWLPLTDADAYYSPSPGAQDNSFRLGVQADAKEAGKKKTTAAASAAAAAAPSSAQPSAVTDGDAEMADAEQSTSELEEAVRKHVGQPTGGSARRQSPSPANLCL